MKNILKSTVILLIVVGSSSSCDKLRNLRMNEIVDILSDTTCISLEDTKWKLVGIVDAQTGILTELEPKDCKECYTLTFDTDTTAQGMAVRNIVFVEKLNPIKVVRTLIWESINDANIYCNAMASAESYTSDRYVLKIFYKDDCSTDIVNKYLLFKLTCP